MGNAAQFKPPLQRAVLADKNAGGLLGRCIDLLKHHRQEDRNLALPETVKSDAIAQEETLCKLCYLLVH